MTEPTNSPEVRRDPIAAARWVLDRYAVEKPEQILVEAMVVDLGLSLADGDLSGAGARLTRVGTGGVIRLSDALAHPGRRRFSIAHELGHFLLRHQETGWLRCLEEEMNEFGGRSSAETEANLFAAELLLPEAMIRERVGASHMDFGSLIRLAEEFQTSVTSCALRFVEITPARSAMVFSRTGRVSWWRRSKSFGCWLRGSGEELHPASSASRYFSGKEVPVRPTDVGAEAWLEEKDAQGRTIAEDSMVIPSMKAVLTLLSIPPAEGHPFHPGSHPGSYPGSSPGPGGSPAERSPGRHGAEPSTKAPTAPRGAPSRSGPGSKER